MTIKAETLIDIAKKMDYPKVYTVTGVIADCRVDNFKGSGVANVTLYASGLAEINYEYKVTAKGSGNETWCWGLNRNLLHSLNNEIPLIEPMRGGVIHYFNYSLNYLFEGYAGSHWYVEHTYWEPGRIFQEIGSEGGWPSNKLPIDCYVTGIAYGKFEV